MAVPIVMTIFNQSEYIISVERSNAILIDTGQDNYKATPMDSSHHCDQIWRNFAILGMFNMSLAIL